MKTLIYLFGIVLFLSACEKEEIEKQTSIIIENNTDLNIKSVLLISNSLDSFIISDIKSKTLSTEIPISNLYSIKAIVYFTKKIALTNDSVYYLIPNQINILQIK